MIEYRDVQAAQARIAPHIVRTPLLRVPALDEALGCQVYLKHEGFQTIGAFKLRGALNKALSLSEEELGRGLVCASSGNHAQGVAYAAHKLGAQAVIVMPTNTNPVKLAGVKRWGGQVELVGTLSSQREERAAQLVRERGMVEIHPYADPLVAAGQGTLALEVLEDLPDASLIAAPIGGGGLISGIATAVKGAAPQVTSHNPTNKIGYGIDQFFALKACNDFCQSKFVYPLKKIVFDHRTAGKNLITKKNPN